MCLREALLWQLWWSKHFGPLRLSVLHQPHVSRAVPRLGQTWLFFYYNDVLLNVLEGDGVNPWDVGGLAVSA